MVPPNSSLKNVNPGGLVVFAVGGRSKLGKTFRNWVVTGILDGGVDPSGYLFTLRRGERF